ncbi:hypothetical protein Acsp01_01080 [Actinoplanes sp. NBRC 101535]|nr:hypothetical protein Acsp01_01080 [Actinoplanes sp. NBRC 101535]
MEDCQGVRNSPDQTVVLVISVQRPCDHRSEIQRSVPLLGVAGLRELAERGKRGEPDGEEAFVLDDQPSVEFIPEGSIGLKPEPIDDDTRVTSSIPY